MSELLVVGGRFPGLRDHAGRQAAVRVSLYATPGDDAPLWTDVLPAIPVGEGGAAHLVLGVGAPLPATVFVRYPRYLAVSVDGCGHLGPRRPVTGAALRLGARVAALENSGAAGGLDDETRRMLARLPSRLRTLADGYADMHARLVALEDGAAAARPGPDAASGNRLTVAEDRLQRIEDQVEDLVGPPHGEVVTMARRVVALEAEVAALRAVLARLGDPLATAATESSGPQ
ncbi:MAG: hypothetical protein VX265_08925 [Myxococcota bacterium]|nr:hypothetical protein [Myxococcota bacterium]